MRVPLQWLADYVAIELPTDELAHKLTMAGIKVEAVERIGADWQDVVIGEVVELEPHPKSKKPLHVARVDLGDRRLTVVTGAQNVFLGARVAVVPAGGLLPHGPDGEPMVMQEKPMAGITSEGMLASERELGISDEHSGIFILPADAPVGEPLRSVLGGDVLEIETNPNRPDTLSIIGIAREVAAVTEQQLTLPDLGAVGGPLEYVDEESIHVEVAAPDLCPRYSALRIEGVEAATSPIWLAGRLEAAGMRPISLLVDLTNYVMLEYGQPMHAFDAAQLQGGRIVVRRARQGETLRTLDGVERVLSSENLVIADGERAVAIAGVMGGENSEVSSDTSSVVLESANFDPVSVRRTAQALNLRTEASSRFEKGLPPEQTVLGLRRYLQLLEQITAAPMRVYDISDVWVGAPEPRIVRMPLRDLHRLIGIPVSIETAAEKMSLLGFDVEVEDEAIAAAVPFWRRADVALSADLVEEVSRMIGFDAVPSTLPRRTMPPPAPDPLLRWESAVRERLLATGATEIVTGTLTSERSMARLFRPGSNGHAYDSPDTWARLVPNLPGIEERQAMTLPLHLINPPTRDRDTLRLTLLASALDVVSRNLKHTDERVAFFEVARTYFPRTEELPYERRTLVVALSGRRVPRSWQNPDPAAFSFYDGKGMVTQTLEALQVDGWQVQPAEHPALHPGRAAAIILDGRAVGYLGELHPLVAERFEIEGWPVQVAEIDLDALFPLATDRHIIRAIPRYPAAYRDIAVVLPQDVPAAEVVRVVRQAAGDIVESATIFDVYAGPQLPPDKKSVAVGMELRAPESTLGQHEISAAMDRIVQALREELGGTLRA
jgi:phenylalanyl-tRNA synthetase beta chain